MALSVRTNLASIRASFQLNRTQTNLTSSLERISSGLRVNRAADDSAGLSVASRMDSDNTSLKQAIRNANDGVSMVQTAEGGLNEIYNVLVRMRELAVQASNETYNSTDRSQMNTEFNQLVEEIARIASVAQFNRTEILKGNASSSVLDIQVGIHANSDNKIEINLNTIAATLVALGLATIKASGITTLSNAATSITTLDTALNAINSRRAYLGAVQNRLENAINEATNYSENLSASSSQILDVDYAEESANMTRYQIMQQAGVAALGQAKAIPQSVVSLLS